MVANRAKHNRYLADAWKLDMAENVNSDEDNPLVSYTASQNFSKFRLDLKCPSYNK